MPILKNFKIRKPKRRSVCRPSKVIANAIYDTDETRKYNRRREIKSIGLVNVRNRKKKKRRRPIMG